MAKVMNMNPIMLIAHFVAGIKSKIPICCVLYYCFWIYLPKRYPPRFNKGESDKGIRYFRCPLCRMRGEVATLLRDGKGEEYYYCRFTNREN